MKELLFTNWHIARWIRVVFAFFLFAQAYVTQQWFFIAFGLFFLAQGILNLGCANSNCEIPKFKRKMHE